MQLTVQAEVKVNRDLLEDYQIDENTGAKVYFIDYGVDDGSGEWTLTGSYCNGMLSATVEMSGDYENWTEEDFLHELT